MVQTLPAFTATETELSWESTHSDVLSPYDPSVPPGCPRETWSSEGFAALATPDRSVVENRQVRCPIARPVGVRDGEVLDKACVLLHGLNERGWDKYFGWAQAIADEARCVVILFPIAFHMDRSPASWANFGIMRGVSKDRIARYTGLKQSSMANAAISERLDEAPSRLYLSGLMAARDLGDLVASIRSGELPLIASDATLGFFGYSIGAYLLQCLSLADERFARAGKRFLFCGFLSAMTPVSKYIIDSRAHRRILDFWVYDLETELRRDPELAALVDTPEGRAYCAMVDPRHPQMNRRSVFSDGATQVASLTGDDVMPMPAIIDFFEGHGRGADLFRPSSGLHAHRALQPRGRRSGAQGFRETDRRCDGLHVRVAEHVRAIHRPPGSRPVRQGPRRKRHRRARRVQLRSATEWTRHPGFGVGIIARHATGDDDDKLASVGRRRSLVVAADSDRRRQLWPRCGSFTLAHR